MKKSLEQNGSKPIKGQEMELIKSALNKVQSDMAKVQEEMTEVKSELNSVKNELSRKGRET